MASAESVKEAIRLIPVRVATSIAIRVKTIPAIKAPTAACWAHQAGEVTLAQIHANVNAVATHVGSKDLEQSDVANRIDKAAYPSEAERNGDFLPSAELTCLGHRRESAAFAAWKPHMPCTPPPGGVDEEHR